MQLPHDPETVLLGTYPTEMKRRSHQKPPANAPDDLMCNNGPKPGVLQQVEVSKACCLHSVEHSSSIKRDTPLPHAATWVKLQGKANAKGHALSDPVYTMFWK